MSLAHYGVLFLDELPEFDRNALEVMRGPLEDRKITISRANCTLTYPCNFMFIASMNPCPCGYANDSVNKCTCTPQQISKYVKKISGPLLDRIDLHIEVQPVEYERLQDDAYAEDSKSIKERVNQAKKIQKERYLEYNVLSNSELTQPMIKKFCKLNNDAQSLLKDAFKQYGFSARTYTRILKVARTIADLAKSENIEIEHIAEAIQYRVLDKKISKEN